MMSNILILAFFAILAIGNHPSDGGPVTGADFQPQFAEPLENQTVAIGRDATFTCVVKGLGGYRVGWVRADSKAIQAIHTHVITHNPRVSVSHSDHTMWHLTIKGVKEEDRGAYMCQINTDPMISQVATLEVVIPPEFIPEETSGDIMAPEGSTVKLTCKARGHPSPSIKWRREDGQNITLKSQGTKTQVTVHEGEILKLQKISRADMGTYLCIASNSVPPSISKRITVAVHFHPVIHVPNQLVGAPLNTDVTLECNVEAYPRSIHFWVKDKGSAMIISADRFEVQEITKSMFEVKMVLIIRKFRKSDVGSYHCIAKNSLGDVDSVVKLHEFKVDGAIDLDERTGAPGKAFDDEDDLDSFFDYDGEQDLGTISRSNNRNRHTYADNKNSVVVGAGGGTGGGSLSSERNVDRYSSNTGTASGIGGGGGGSYHTSNNNHNNNRGKHTNYTPGGERERNNASNNEGGGRRGGKGGNRQERRKTGGGGGGGGKYLDNHSGSIHNVYQTQLEPDGGTIANSGAESIHSTSSFKSTNNNDYNSSSNKSNDKAFAINNFVPHVVSQFLCYFQNLAYHHPVPFFISGSGLILQIVLNETGRRFSFFVLL